MAVVAAVLVLVLVLGLGLGLGLVTVHNDLRLTKEYYSTYFILVALFVVAGAISRPFSKALATVHRQQVLVPCSHLVPLIRQIYDRLASHDRHEDRTTTA